ncbi:hypothetical protein [Actinocatenispora comari]|nr:hypothetical protein [Actinocatenispora comari]
MPMHNQRDEQLDVELTDQHDGGGSTGPDEDSDVAAMEQTIRHPWTSYTILDAWHERAQTATRHVRPARWWAVHTDSTGSAYTIADSLLSIARHGDVPLEPEQLAGHYVRRAYRIGLSLPCPPRLAGPVGLTQLGVWVAAVAVAGRVEALVGWQAADRLIHRLWGCADTETHSRSPLTQRLAVELSREVGGQPVLGLPELVQIGIHHHTDTQPIASHHLLRTTLRNSSPESGRSEITAATLSVLDLRNTHLRA